MTLTSLIMSLRDVIRDLRDKIHRKNLSVFVKE